MHGQPKPSVSDDLAQVLRYHEETKHHPGRYARSSGYMDWANQPDPFRSYEGAIQIELPLEVPDPAEGHLALYRQERLKPAVPDLETISGFLSLSMGLSAWKSFGDNAWALRMNPSSGNLHPTECHLLHPPLGRHPAGVSHYNAYRHSLELRAAVPAALWDKTAERFGPGFGLCLSCIFWRESWKYGERALRYTQHDAGHALAALRIAANLFGWRVTMFRDAADGQIERVFGLNRGGLDEIAGEHVDMMLWVGSGDGPFPGSLDARLDAAWVAEYAALDFRGEPTPLSRETVRWDRIYQTAERLSKPETTERATLAGEISSLRKVSTSLLSAAQIIRNRRSAQRFDRKGYISLEAFLSILEKTLPRHDCAPFDVGIAPSCVDLVLFVHRVRDLAPGLYCFSRTGGAAPSLKRHLHHDFSWFPVSDTLPLFLLQEGDVQDAAALVSCGQDIAGDAAFSLGMIARFKAEIETAPWRYKQLFWETGMIGQVLYLEAEAHGVRGTGIGCFFDDLVHNLLGITDTAYQSLYHFTVGVPVTDARLTTLPPYHHLKR